MVEGGKKQTIRKKIRVENGGKNYCGPEGAKAVSKSLIEKRSNAR
jgi:hypothetical protein